MSGFAEQVNSFAAKVGVATRADLVTVATEALRSIQYGSEITGAPGQPIDEGTLVGSWQLTFPTPDSASITTNLDYARAVEDAIGPHGPVVYGAAGNGRSVVGGSHSVKLTMAALPRIVEVVAGGQR